MCPLLWCLFSLQATCTFPSRLHAFSLSASSLMCPLPPSPPPSLSPPSPLSPPPSAPLTIWATVDKGSSIMLSLLSPGACEFKIWQKMSGVLDEWKVLRALAENLYCDNLYYVCVLMNLMQYDQNYTTSLLSVLYYATVKERAQRTAIIMFAYQFWLAMIPRYPEMDWWLPWRCWNFLSKTFSNSLTSPGPTGFL